MFDDSTSNFCLPRLFDIDVVLVEAVTSKFCLLVRDSDSTSSFLLEAMAGFASSFCLPLGACLMTSASTSSFLRPSLTNFGWPDRVSSPSSFLVEAVTGFVSVSSTFNFAYWSVVVIFEAVFFGGRPASLWRSRSCLFRVEKFLQNWSYLSTLKKPYKIRFYKCTSALVFSFL